jgi:hypothetical protein
MIRGRSIHRIRAGRPCQQQKNACVFWSEGRTASSKKLQRCRTRSTQTLKLVSPNGCEKTHMHLEIFRSGISHPIPPVQVEETCRVRRLTPELSLPRGQAFAVRVTIGRSPSRSTKSIGTTTVAEHFDRCRERCADQIEAFGRIHLKLFFAIDNRSRLK